MSQPAAKRTFHIPTAYADAYGNPVVEDAQEAEAWLGRMLTTLVAVGGTLVIQSVRYKTGELGGEPLAITGGLVATWTSQAGQLHDLAELTGGSTAPPELEDIPEPALAGE